MGGVRCHSIGRSSFWRRAVLFHVARELALNVASHRNDPVTLGWLSEGDAHGVPALRRHFFHVRAHDLAGLHDDQHLVRGIDQQCANQVAALSGQRCYLDAKSTSVLRRPCRHGSALGKAVLCDHERIGFACSLGRFCCCVGSVFVRGIRDSELGRIGHRRIDDVHGQQLVVAAEPHALHARGRSAHGTQFFIGGVEAHRLALA